MVAALRWSVIRPIAVFYFGHSSGGLWKTEDVGTYWIPVGDGQFRYGSVGAIALHEKEPVEELASAKKIDVSYARRMFRLISLAPDIVEAILQNDAPDHLSLRTLYRGIPLCWEEQGQEWLSRS